MQPRLTQQQRNLMAALRAGHRTTRALMEAAGVSSTSVVKAELERLAAAGLIVLEQTTRGAQVYDGRDYASAWDAACRLSGNPEA